MPGSPCPGLGAWRPGAQGRDSADNLETRCRHRAARPASCAQALKLAPCLTADSGSKPTGWQESDRSQSRPRTPGPCARHTHTHTLVIGTAALSASRLRAYWHTHTHAHTRCRVNQGIAVQAQIPQAGYARTAETLRKCLRNGGSSEGAQRGCQRQCRWAGRRGRWLRSPGVAAEGGRDPATVLRQGGAPDWLGVLEATHNPPSR